MFNQELLVGNEVKVKARMALEPPSHVQVLVGSVVVEDQMNRNVGLGFSVDLVEEPYEFLMPVPWNTAR